MDLRDAAYQITTGALSALSGWVDDQGVETLQKIAGCLLLRGRPMNTNVNEYAERERPWRKGLAEAESTAPPALESNGDPEQLELEMRPEPELTPEQLEELNKVLLEEQNIETLPDYTAAFHSTSSLVNIVRKLPAYWEGKMMMSSQEDRRQHVMDVRGHLVDGVKLTAPKTPILQRQVDFLSDVIPPFLDLFVSVLGRETESDRLTQIIETGLRSREAKIHTAICLLYSKRGRSGCSRINKLDKIIYPEEWITDDQLEALILDQFRFHPWAHRDDVLGGVSERFPGKTIRPGGWKAATDARKKTKAKTQSSKRVLESVGQGKEWRFFVCWIGQREVAKAEIRRLREIGEFPTFPQPEVV